MSNQGDTQATKYKAELLKSIKQDIRADIEDAISCGAIEARDPYLLDYAIETGSKNIVCLALEHQHTLNESSFLKSIMSTTNDKSEADIQRRADISRILVEYNVPIARDDIKQVAAVKFLFPDVLMQAIILNNNAKIKNMFNPLSQTYITIRKLLPAQPTITSNYTDNYGYTPLHLAAARGNVQATQKLLEHGADVSATNDKRDRITALSLAVRNSRYTQDLSAYHEIICLLLEYNAPIDPFNNHHRSCIESGLPSDLMRAIIFNDIKRVKNILKGTIGTSSDTEISTKDSRGNTALHMAMARNAKKIAKKLLKYGASIEAANIDNLKPLALAERNGHKDLPGSVLQCLLENTHNHEVLFGYAKEFFLDQAGLPLPVVSYRTTTFDVMAASAYVEEVGKVQEIQTDPLRTALRETIKQRFKNLKKYLADDA